MFDSYYFVHMSNEQQSIMATIKAEKLTFIYEKRCKIQKGYILEELRKQLLQKRHAIIKKKFYNFQE